jgi:hypothetical protein
VLQRQEDGTFGSKVREEFPLKTIQVSSVVLIVEAEKGIWDNPDNPK